MTQGSESAFSIAGGIRRRSLPPGEGGRAQRGRMRFVPLQYAEHAVFPEFPFRMGSSGILRLLCGWVSCFVNPVDSRKARGGLRLRARGLRRPGAIAAPGPAQGVSPLDPFSLARSRGGLRLCPFVQLVLDVAGQDIHNAGVLAAPGHDHVRFVDVITDILVVHGLHCGQVLH